MFSSNEPSEEETFCCLFNKNNKVLFGEMRKIHQDEPQVNKYLQGYKNNT